MSSTYFTPALQLQRQLSYTKFLVSDVSNAQNRALKKRNMDSNPRYGPGRIIKGDKEDIVNYKSNSLSNLNLKVILLILKNQMQKDISYYNR